MKVTSEQLKNAAKDINTIPFDKPIPIDKGADKIIKEIKECVDNDLIEGDDDLQEDTWKIIDAIGSGKIKIEEGKKETKPGSPLKKETKSKPPSKKEPEGVGFGSQLIDIDLIKPDPDQPRKTFSNESIKSLADSIKETEGIIDPVVVTQDEKGQYIIVSGERRYRALKLLKMKKVPCFVKPTNKDSLFATQLIANLQRENLDAIDEANAIKQLIKTGYTRKKLSAILGKSQSYISQILGVDRLTPAAKKEAKKSKVSKEVQIQASKEKDKKKQEKVVKEAAAKKKTVKEVRKDTTPKTKDTKVSSWEWKTDDFTIIVKFKEKFAKSTAAKKGKESIKIANDNLNK